MNGEKFTTAMGQIGDRYVEEALFYAAPSAANVRRRRLGVLLAAVIATLALCGFASHELGLLDPWFQAPSDDPVQVVRSAIEGQADKAYTICVRVEEIAVDETETARAAAMYAGSELAEALGVKCYDSELINETAKESGFAESFVQSHEEQRPGSFLYSLYFRSRCCVSQGIWRLNARMRYKKVRWGKVSISRRMLAGLREVAVTSTTEASLA